MGKQNTKITDKAAPPTATRNGAPTNQGATSSGAGDAVADPRMGQPPGDPGAPPPEDYAPPQTPTTIEQRAASFDRPVDGRPIVDVGTASRGTGSQGNASRPFKGLR